MACFGIIFFVNVIKWVILFRQRKNHATLPFSKNFQGKFKGFANLFILFQIEHYNGYTPTLMKNGLCNVTLHENKFHKCVFHQIDNLSVLTLYAHRVKLKFRIQSECGKIRTRKTSNTDTFHAVAISVISIHKKVSQLCFLTLFIKENSV